MAKLIASLGVLFLIGTLGAASFGGDISSGPASAAEPIDWQAPTTAGFTEVTRNQVAPSFTEATPMGLSDMSDKEKERRRDACGREWKARDEWCSGTTKLGTEPNKACYKQSWDKYVACLKPIS